MENTSLGNAAEDSGPGSSGLPSVGPSDQALQIPIAPAREPLLSDEIGNAHWGDASDFLYGRWSNMAEALENKIADFEAKITSGELRVVKKATNEHAENHINTRTFFCSNCHIHTERVFRYAPTGSPRTVKFCPGCGSEILPL